MPRHYPASSLNCSNFQENYNIRGGLFGTVPQAGQRIVWRCCCDLAFICVNNKWIKPLLPGKRSWAGTHNTMGQLSGHQLVTSLTMINIHIGIVFVTLTSRLCCEGFVILDPDTENIDYKSGYKIVSINGENLEKSQPFREISSEEEYSKEDVQFSSLIPALRKGLKKVRIFMKLFNSWMPQ